MVNKIILIILALILIPSVMAVCTVTLNKAEYYSGETATATMGCSTASEKSQSYSLEWRNGTNVVMQTDTGTTPSTIGANFFKTYAIPLSVNWTNANATLTVTGSTKVFDWFNVSPTNTNTLLIGDFSFSGDRYVGKNLGIGFYVRDKNYSRITNAYCRVRITKGSTDPILVKEALVIDGVGAVNFKLDTESFEEGSEYIASIRCECPLANSSQNYCFDTLSNPVYASYGSAQAPFNISRWLQINTVVDQTVYKQKEEIFICANVTNLYTEDYTLLTQLNYLVRCSSGVDNYADLDWAIVISDHPGSPDLRGIPFNSTRMQCKRFVVPEPRYLQGKSSQCFASSYVSVLYEQVDNIMKSYRTDSPVFNITLDELQIQPDWQRQSTYQWTSIINLSESSYNDWSGVGVSNLDLRLDKVVTDLTSTEQTILPRIDESILYNTKYIKNWTSLYCNGSAVPDSGLEVNDDGNLEIEVRNVLINKTGCYNITLNLNSFEERSAEALEGIENKTGTFHFDIACPANGVIGQQMQCVLTAQIESGDVQKEVDFTCYIPNNNVEYSTINFNQMVTVIPYIAAVNITVPSNFLAGQQYTVFCEANYYNLGSRTDTFYDTFTADTIQSASGGSAGGDAKSDEIGTEAKKGQLLGVALKDWGILLLGLVVLLIFTNNKEHIGVKIERE